MSADLKFIRGSIPIEAVAAELGLERVGNMYRCFRPDAHQNGDRTPSMGKSRANRLKCFCCDAKPLSNLDLIMGMLNLSLAEAVKWVTDRFPGIPAAPKGKHLEHAQKWPERERIGASASGLENIIRSGVWATFSHAEQSLLPVLDMFADPSARTVTISYRGMQRYAGIGSRATVSAALRTFEKLHLIQVQKGKEAGLRAVGVYVLTFNDPDFLEYAFSLKSQNREAIRVERALRATAREQRRKALGRGSCIPPRPLASPFPSSAEGAFITGKTLSSVGEPVPKFAVQSDCTANLGKREKAGVLA